jgi:predicted ATPase
VAQVGYVAVRRGGLRSVRSLDCAGLGVLGEALVSNRRAMGLTQEELSERSGVSVRTIRNLEAGVITSPRESTTGLLLQALNADPVAGPGSRQLRGGSGGRDRPVGRERDLEHVGRAVRQWRLVVLTGPVGVGKTRLAAEIGDRMGGWFRHGVVSVQAGVLEPDRPGGRGEGRVRAQIDAALTRRLDDPDVLVSPAGGADEPDLLLIIDTAEHVLGSVAQAVRSVLAEWPGVHVLVTSRRPLPVTLARHWEVRPLACGPLLGQPGVLAPAVELFLQRAEASCPTLDLSGQTEPVTRLCQRLDGLPFALELAAARIRSVPIATMLAGGPACRVLGGADCGGLPHQGSLSDSIRWSYDLLTGDERALLHQLTQFRDDFTFQDAHVGTVASIPMADLLAALVDSSLLQVIRGATYQYRLPSTIREYLDTIPPATVPAPR